MLMLLFRVKDETWALPTAEIKELISLVTLQSCSYSKNSVSGLLNYHGEYLPVIDVSNVIAQQRATHAFSTRIAVVDIEVDSSNSTTAASVFRLGLILEKAYKIPYLTQSADLSSQKSMTAPLVHSVFQGAEGVVQRLSTSALLSQVGIY